MTTTGIDRQRSASMLRYWHPVMSSADLQRGSVRPIRIAGVEIAVFRGSDGMPGAVVDQCAHRRMKLSAGHVEDERLVCPYHGWAYRRGGEGESPGTPRLRACIDSFACAEAAGAIWIRQGTCEELDAPSVPGLAFTGADFSVVRAPLELVIDNFSEVEHTLAMHPDFGFDRDLAVDASAVLETTDDSVTILSHGPAKMPPIDTRMTGGIRRGDRFHSDFTFRFDPPRSSVHHYWRDGKDAAARHVEYRLVHYFVPIDASSTSIVTFGFLDLRRAAFRMFATPAAWMFRKKLRRTVEEDARVVENLADHSTSLEGMKLGRFDAVLGMTRERLQRIYYGAAAE